MWLVDLQESVFLEKGLGPDQNSGLFSVNVTDLSSREHWWDLINFESILILSGLILCLSKTVKYLVCPSKWRIKLTIWEVVFFLALEEIAHSFFSFLFDILE